jgi:hypothetical protein
MDHDEHRCSLLASAHDGHQTTTELNFVADMFERSHQIGFDRFQISHRRPLNIKEKVLQIKYDNSTYCPTSILLLNILITFNRDTDT